MLIMNDKFNNAVCIEISITPILETSYKDYIIIFRSINVKIFIKFDVGQFLFFL